MFQLPRAAPCAAPFPAHGPRHGFDAAPDDPVWGLLPAAAAPLCWASALTDGTPNVADGLRPLNLRLCLFGEAMLRGALASWWDTWSKRSHGCGGVAQELSFLASGGAAPLSSDLRAWLLSFGQGVESLSPSDAMRWLGAFRQLAACPQSPCSF